MKEDQTDRKSAAERETAEYDGINYYNHIKNCVKNDDIENRLPGQEIFEW